MKTSEGAVKGNAKGTWLVADREEAGVQTEKKLECYFSKKPPGAADKGVCLTPTRRTKDGAGIAGGALGAPLDGQW
jgi:hypothetical protein